MHQSISLPSLYVFEAAPKALAAAAALLALLCETGAASAASTCIDSAPILTVSWPSEATAVTCGRNIFMPGIYTYRAYVTTKTKKGEDILLM